MSETMPATTGCPKTNGICRRITHLWDKIPLWFWLVTFWILALGLRFWNLSDFNVMVFDEVHFARFASSYLTHTTFFENHPPLAKYIIAVGIWLNETLGIVKGETNTLVGHEMTPFSYRWMNALFGSFWPPLLAYFAYQLNGKKKFAILTGIFASVEALALVESRYALINIYILLFGFLGMSLLLAGLRRQGKKRLAILALSGLALGASIAVKLTGLAFPLGLGLVIIAAWCAPKDESNPTSLFSNLRSVRFYELFLMAALGLSFYALIWIPHLQLNTNMNFWEWHQYMINSHLSVGSNIHPYCSTWYSWPFLIRPVAYLFQNSIMPGTTTDIYRDVHALGNPVLWWLSSLGLFAVLAYSFQRLSLATSSFVSKENRLKLLSSSNFWIAAFFAIGFTVNMLPWLSISRCTFLYHYMPAGTFSLLALAWLLTELSERKAKIWGTITLLIVVASLASFAYWFPIYYGLPLPSQDFFARMLFKTWI